MSENIFPSRGSVVFALIVTTVVLALHVALRWLDVPAGDLLDWGVAVAGFWWLLGVTTVPWNIYFAARRVAGELQISRERDLTVSSADEAYVDQASRRGLAVAVLLHGLSAAGFGALAWSGLTPVGWVAAAAALALTAFRPTVALYQHIVQTLVRIDRRAHMPRADVRSLEERVELVVQDIAAVRSALDLRTKLSWASVVEERLGTLKGDADSQAKRLDGYERRNQAEHEALQRRADSAVERIGEDVAFLGNVREIIRFVKDA